MRLKTLRTALVYAFFFNFVLYLIVSFGIFMKHSAQLVI